MSGLHGQFGLWEGVLRLEQCLDHTVWTLGESSPTQTMSGSHSLDFGREFSDSSNIWISQFGLWGKSSPTQAMSGSHSLDFGGRVLRLKQCLDYTDSLDFGREFSDSSNVWIIQFGLWGRVLRLKQCLDYTDSLDFWSEFSHSSGGYMNSWTLGERFSTHHVVNLCS